MVGKGSLIGGGAWTMVCKLHIERDKYSKESKVFRNVRCKSKDERGVELAPRLPKLTLGYVCNGNMDF